MGRPVNWTNYRNRLRYAQECKERETNRMIKPKTRRYKDVVLSYEEAKQRLLSRKSQ